MVCAVCDGLFAGEERRNGVCQDCRQVLLALKNREIDGMPRGGFLAGRGIFVPGVGQ